MINESMRYYIRFGIKMISLLDEAHHEGHKLCGFFHFMISVLGMRVLTGSENENVGLISVRCTN
jgi:hypothetical protein